MLRATPGVMKMRPRLLTSSPQALASAVAAIAVAVGLLARSPAAGIVVLAYGLAGCHVLMRRRARLTVTKNRTESLELLASSAADLRAGATVSLLFLPDPELDRLAQAALRVSDRTGAPLAELLERLDRQQRELARAEAAAHAQAAGIRATAVLLTLLPLAALGLGHAIGANALGALLSSSFGMGSVAVAVALQLSGLAWADRLAGNHSWSRARKRGLRRLARKHINVATPAELAATADLIAAALRAGTPVSTAVLSIAETMTGPLSRPLLRIGHELRLGVPAEVAWQGLAELDAAKRLVQAAKRSANSGSALSGALTRCADDLRADATCEKQAQLQRSAVLLVLPLGLCFLPAFVLAGLVPVILAVLGEVL